MKIHEYTDTNFLAEKEEYLARTVGDKILLAYKNDPDFKREGEKSTEEILQIMKKHDVNNRYLQWIARQYIRGNFFLEDLGRVQDALEKFDQVKKRLDLKDIGQYKKLADLEDAIDSLDPEKSKRQQQIQIKTVGAEKALETDRFVVMRIKNKEAAKYYGKGTRWCTAAEKNNRFDQYHKLGWIYVLIDKTTGRKWQLHNETRQFMDERDEEIPLSDLKMLFTDPSIKQMIVGGFLDCLDESTHFAVFTPEELIEMDADPAAIIGYVSHHKKTTPELEEFLINNSTSFYLYQYAFALKKRIPEIEEKLLSNDNSNKVILSVYAKNVIKGRWKEAEPLIMSDLLKDYNPTFHVSLKDIQSEELRSAIDYAIFVNRPFEEIEEALNTHDPYFRSMEELYYEFFPHRKSKV